MKYSKFSKLFYLFFGIIILLGIFLRFTNIDYKVYWHDETYTSIYISGFFRSEWKENLFTGKILELQQLQYYLQSHSHKNVGDTIHVLAINNPHHPPLYYILVREWRQIFGESIAVIRSFSAWISLLVFPTIYWLAWELFKQPIVSCISLLLIAISPFHILYAQEARAYALWTVLISLLSASLLSCIQLTKSSNRSLSKTYLSWGTYAIFTTLSLYTSLLTVFIIIAQISYSLLLDKFRLSKVVIFQGFSLLVSVILFSPWIKVFIDNYRQYKYSTAWTREFHFSALFLLKKLAFNLTRIFIDFGLDLESKLTNLVIAICLFLLGYSLYFLVKNAPKKSCLFIIFMMFIPVLFLLIPDIILGGVRSFSPRYLIAFYIMVHVTVAYLLGNKLISYQIFNTKIWSIITLIIFSISLLSSITNSLKNTAYTKVVSYNLPKVAEIINKSNSSLLIGENHSYNPGNIMALSYLLNDNTKLQLLSNSDNYQLPKKFKNIFLLNPTNTLKESLGKSKKIDIKQIFRDDHIWLYKVNFLK